MEQERANRSKAFEEPEEVTLIEYQREATRRRGDELGFGASIAGGHVTFDTIGFE